MNTDTQDQQGRGLWTSASNAAADKRCQGRFLAQRGLAEIKSDDAEHGRAIHDALKTQDPSSLDVDQRDIYDSCLAIEKKIVMQYFGIDEETFNERRTPIRERRFWIHWKDNLQHSGQVDCADRMKTKALIIEYKTLVGDVPGSSENIQLRDQAVLFDHNNPLLQEIGTVVIQPLVTHSPKVCVYNRQHLQRSMVEMHDRVVMSHNTNARRVAGELQCKFCLAAKHGACAEYNTYAGGLVASGTPLTEVPVAEWTPEQCVVFCEKLGLAQRWLDDCKEVMKARLKANPDAVPGWMLKDGDKRQTIINAQAVFERFSEIGGSLNQFMAIIGIGKGDLKEAIAKITKARGKTLTAELEAVIGKDFTEKQCAPELARKK